MVAVLAQRVAALCQFRYVLLQMSFSSQMPWRRLSPFALLLLLAAAAAGFYALPFLSTAPTVPAVTQPLGPSPMASAGPSFDVVRVAPDGGLVMAGSAAPGAKVTVKSGDQVVGEADADARGAWVMTPDGKLAPGASELTLSARDAAGKTAVADAPVLVTVPGHPTQAPLPPAAAAAPPAMAVLASPAGPSRLLQGPAGHSAGHALALDTVDYDEHGAIRFSGAAPPDAPVRVYVDNAPVGDAMAGADGRWTLSPAAAVPPGLHRLRVDQLTPQGRVANRIAMPFQRETLALAQVTPGQVLVQPGQNLWRLARQAYGNGIRYTVIYLANKDQIRNANLIYPGQVFAVPASDGPASRR